MRRTENRGTRFLHLNRDDAPPFTRLGTWRSVMQEVGGYARVGTETRAAFRSHVTECMWSSGHGGEVTPPNRPSGKDTIMPWTKKVCRTAELAPISSLFPFPFPFSASCCPDREEAEPKCRSFCMQCCHQQSMQMQRCPTKQRNGDDILSRSSQLKNDDSLVVKSSTFLQSHNICPIYVKTHVGILASDPASSRDTSGP